MALTPTFSQSNPQKEANAFSRWLSIDKHASVWGIFGKRNYFCSFVEICDSYGGLWLGISLRTNRAGLLRYVIAAQNNKGLSVSTWRKKGGDLASTTMWGWKRGVIIKYPARPCIGFEQDEGVTENGEGMRMEGDSRGDRFAGEDVLAQ